VALASSLHSESELLAFSYRQLVFRPQEQQRVCVSRSLSHSLAAAPFYLKKEGDKSFLKFICSQCSAVKKNKLARAGNKSIERGWIRAEAKNM
jgi:hypothetical protein